NRPRHPPRAAVDAARVFQRGLEPLGRKTLGPVADGAIRERAFGRKLAEIVEHRGAECGCRANIPGEATEPHAIAPQDVIERAVDRAEERAAITLALVVRKACAAGVQTLVDPRAVTRHRAAILRRND